MNRFVRPAIGIGVAALVATGAIVVGARAATPETPSTVEATILAPTAIDGVAAEASANGVGLDVSAGAGTVAITEPGPGDPSALPSDIEAAVEALDAAGGTDDAGGYLTVFGTGDSGDSGTDGSGGTGADDPCSPPDGFTPDGCPDGLHSAIFADTMPPELAVYPVADVSTSPVGTSIYCPDLTPASGELGLGVATTVPAAVTVRYWPAANPADVHTVAPDGVQSQVDDWNARFASTGSYPEHEFVFQHCGLLTGLTPSTDYVLSAIALDDFGRISDPVERRFNSAGQPTIPPMQVIPLTNNLLYVSVPNYGTANPPLVKAFVVAPGEATDCTAYDSSHAQVQRVPDERLVEVSADYLHAHNYADGYNHAVVDLFDAPEGSTIVVCARWFDASAPVWDRGTPTRQQWVIAETPDVVVPVVTLQDVSLLRDTTASTGGITASTQSGFECGSASFPPEDTSGGTTVAINQTLCDQTASLRSWMAPPGAGGNVVLTTRVTRGHDVVSSHYVLPLSRYACTGTCDLPPTLTYSVPLPLVTVGTGMCGSGFGGDCTPPTEETSLGTATVVVTWVQGNANGRSSWSVGALDSATPDSPPPAAAPEFDTEEYLEATLSTDGWTGTVSGIVGTDRHATYTASIAGDCFTGTPPAAITGTTAPETTGTQTAHISFTGLCPGQTYSVTVELVDDSGARTVASATRGAGAIWWPGSIVTIPVRLYTVTGTLTISTDRSAGFYRAWKLARGSVNFGVSPHITTQYPAAFPDDRCFPAEDRDTVVAGAITGSTGQSRVVQVYVSARATAEGLYFGVNHDADCSWPGPNSFVADDEIDVNWADLRWGVTVTGDLPQQDVTLPSAYASQIHYTLHLQLGPATP